MIQLVNKANDHEQQQSVSVSVCFCNRYCTGLTAKRLTSFPDFLKICICAKHWFQNLTKGWQDEDRVFHCMLPVENIALFMIYLWIKYSIEGTVIDQLCKCQRPTPKTDKSKNNQMNLLVNNGWFWKVCHLGDAYEYTSKLLFAELANFFLTDRRSSINIQHYCFVTSYPTTPIFRH